MKAVRKGKTKIKIDYAKCGPHGEMDPRECGKCLAECVRPVFHLHHVLEKGDDPCDPRHWQVTPVYLSQCTRCMKCTDVCPVDAISVSW
ncbi:MAG: 4Fe-4S binding protein [Candidatus Thorarchaeota archaeon]